MTATEKRLQAIKKERHTIKLYLLAALKNAIQEGVEFGINNKNDFVEWRITPDEYSTDILGMWMKDEDGKLAIDRLVNLIIY